MEAERRNPSINVSLDTLHEEDIRFAEALQCGICLNISYPCLQCCECSYIVCPNCYDNPSFNKLCPIHQNDPNHELRRGNHRLIDVIQKIYFKCRNAPDCPEKLFIEDIEKHLRTCPYERVRCSGYPNCQTLVQRIKLTDHAHQCPYAVFSCQFCQRQFTKDSYKAHEKTCDRRLVKCDNEECKELIEFRLMDAHIDECNHTLMDCERCQKVMRRAEHNTHGLGQCIAYLKAELAKSKATNLILARDLDAFLISNARKDKRIEELQDSIDHLIQKGKRTTKKKVIPKEALAVCEECNIEFEKITSKIYNEDKLNICSRCSDICQRCSGNFKKDQLSSCFHCMLYSCEKCLLGDCEICTAKPVCSACGDKCQSCETKMCRPCVDIHTNTCNCCQNQICKKCKSVCKYCKEFACRECTLPCGECDCSVCVGCLKKNLNTNEPIPAKKVRCLSCQEDA